MTVIRTAVITLPMMIGDIVRELLLDDVELDIVERFDTRERIEDQLRALSPDLVLVGLSPGEPEISPQSFLVVPDAKVIVFSADCRSAYVLERGASWTHLPNFGPDAMIKVIRTIRRDGNI